MKHYAVIGHPIGHTMSPFIHKRLFDCCSVTADYSVFDIAPQELNEKFKSVLSKLDGFNITIPHKQNIIPLLSRLDSRAKLYGSVNTVSADRYGFSGYTTDPDGFVSALNAESISLGGKTVILGCGGVARVMAYEAVQAGAKLTFAVREEDKPMCKALINDIISNFPNADVSLCLISEINCDIDLLVNATPLGMIPRSDLCPVSDKIIAKSSAVFDAVYNPLETVLIKKAKANGSRAVGGMSMLVYQAACAQTIWNGSHFEKEAIDEICAAASEELMNR